MNPPLESLRGLYQRDRVIRAIVDLLEKHDVQDETEVKALDDELARARPPIEHNDVVAALKALEKRKCGRFIVGRKGANSRMKWHVDTTRLRQAASGELDALPFLETLIESDVDVTEARLVASPLSPVQVVTHEGEELVTHTFNLRRNLPVQFQLPSSLTRAEAERLAKFIESLPFE
jgi:hypothetical protein